MTARRHPSQLARVAAALRLGPVTQLDFIAPTCDGGPSVLRLPARVNELRARGFVIEARPVKVGNARLASYRLVREPVERAGDLETSAGAEAAAEQVALDLGVAAPPTAHRPRSPLDPDGVTP